jgi:hypothetical protein
MTFVFGTNTELLYSMPVIGTSITSTSTVVCNTAATMGPFQLPALGNIWSIGNMVGKGLMIVASGGYDCAALNSNTFRLQTDTAIATSAATSGLLCVTGAATAPLSTTGAWDLQVWMSCVSVVANTATFYVSGDLTYGAGNSNSATLYYNVGNSVTAGVPTATSLATNAAQYVDLWTTWATAPTAFVCSQFMVFGLN